jgi:hypothetical protein
MMGHVVRLDITVTVLFAVLAVVGVVEVHIMFRQMDVLSVYHQFLTTDQASLLVKRIIRPPYLPVAQKSYGNVTRLYYSVVSCGIVEYTRPI